jgi:hypothetical protein
MGRSDRLVDMNEVYVHMKTARKEQSAICLWHMEERFGGLTVPKKGCARVTPQIFKVLFWRYLFDDIR